MAKIENMLIQPFEIQVHYKKIKNIYLRIKPDGRIMISAPLGTNKKYITQFVKSRSSWIMAKQQKISEHKNQLPTLEKDEILLFGKPFKGRLSDAELKQLLHEKVLLFYEKYWLFFSKFDSQPLQIKYRVMKSTWGVCRPTVQTITFNKRLVHQPVAFIEYVVLHEMCHLLIPNHGRDFYRLIAYHMPHFKQYKSAQIMT